MATDEFMDTSDEPWCWYYLADCGQWHTFEDDPESPLKNQVIDNFYLLNSRGVFPMLQSVFNFSDMIQIDIKTGKQRRIQRSYGLQRRCCCCFSSVPVFWEMMNPSCPYQLIPLKESTPEYLAVANYTKNDGLLDRALVCIYRIQNQDLWEFYCRKRKQLTRIRGVKDIQEMRLFHGTKKSNVDTICKYNFDIRLSGHHGHIYGKGIYFAIHAAYADKYSCSSSDALPQCAGHTVQAEPTKIMFLARVLVGKSSKGQQQFIKPDEAAKNYSHDSCVDDIQCPKMYVIFDSNQIYPEYLIQYR